MMDDVALLESLRATPDLLAAVAACSPAERASQKSLRGQFPDELGRPSRFKRPANGRVGGSPTLSDSG